MDSFYNCFQSFQLWTTLYQMTLLLFSRLTSPSVDGATSEYFDSQMTSWIFLIGPRCDAREWIGAIISEVSVHLPGFTEVIRPLDKHGGRSERFETHNQVSKVKFSLEVYLNGHVLPAVLGLPPFVFPIVTEVSDNVLNPVAHGV